MKTFDMLGFEFSRIFWIFAILISMCCLGCSKSSSPEAQNPFVASAPVPAPPQWMKDMPLVPDWWTNVTIRIDEGASVSNKWSRIKGMEEDIQAMVRKGFPPTKEREQLIKYLSAIDKSRYSQFEIAQLYESLGDYKWAAKIYVDQAENSPEDGTLYGLALEYERLGDRPSAIKIFTYMSQSFGNDNMNREIGLRGIACLTGTNIDCVLQKPDWWAQHNSLPVWWPDVKVEMPQFTSWEDEFEFFANNIQKRGDKRAVIKAGALLSQFSPITFNEKQMSLLLMGHAYSAAGDHYRAIETGWQIPEQFPHDPMDTIIALEFIASEFDKLGDSKNSAIIKDNISCFKSEAIKAGLKPWR